jgi:hypothetical protein
MKAKNLGLLAVALMGAAARGRPARSSSPRPARVQRTQWVAYFARIQ